MYLRASESRTRQQQDIQQVDDIPKAPDGVGQFGRNFMMIFTTNDAAEVYETNARRLLLQAKFPQTFIQKFSGSHIYIKLGAFRSYTAIQTG